MNDTPRVTVYGNRTCGYCMAARLLLKKKGVKYENVIVSNDPDALAEMKQRSGRDTVPQVFVGDRHIGGFDDLYALDKSGDLDNLLTAG